VSRLSVVEAAVPDTYPRTTPRHLAKRLLAPSTIHRDVPIAPEPRCETQLNCDLHHPSAPFFKRDTPFSKRYTSKSCDVWIVPAAPVVADEHKHNYAPRCIASATVSDIGESQPITSTKGSQALAELLLFPCRDSHL